MKVTLLLQRITLLLQKTKFHPCILLLTLISYLDCLSL